MRIAIVFLVLGLFACETKEHAEAEMGAIKKAQGAAAKASAHAGPSQEEIGIVECDEYIRSVSRQSS